MSTTLIKRKGNSETEPLKDPESGDIAPQDVSQNGNGNNNNSEQNASDKSIIVLFVLVVILGAMVFAAPAHIRKRRADLMDRHFQQAVLVVKDQKSKLAEKYKQLTSSISEEEMLKHKEEIAQLHSAVSSKQDSIDKLTKDIEQQKKILEEVQKQMKKMKDDTSNFCPECKIQMGKMEITCGFRANFIVEQYGDNEDDVKEALIKQYPACKGGN